MRISIRSMVLLVGACLLAGSVLWAQQSQKPARPVSTDLAFTFAYERAQIAPSVCCFWLKGAGADAANRLGLACSRLEQTGWQQACSQVQQRSWQMACFQVREQRLELPAAAELGYARATVHC